jgi:Acetyl-CoA acetyltransferase
MREVIIASSVRTPLDAPSRARSALLVRMNWRGCDQGSLERVPQLDVKEIEDVILGCAMPEAEQGMNVARIASLRAGLPVEISALTINRFCSSGLQAIAMAAERIMTGGAEVHRGRHGIDVHDSHGRTQNFAQPLAGRSLSRRLFIDGTHR